MNMDFKSAKELLALCAENALPISEVMRRRECLLGEVEQDAVDRRMAKAWDIMRASATQPLETPIKSIRSVRRFISFCRSSLLKMPLTFRCGAVWSSQK